MSKHILDPGYWIRFWRDMSDEAFHSVLRVTAVVVAYIILRLALFRLIDAVLSHLSARDENEHKEHGQARLRTLRGLCESVVSYTLLFLSGVLLLKAVGFDILPFVTTAGVIGLAVGFGSQKLIKDVISGFFIIADNLFMVGDTITACGVTGEVQEMAMRVTRLQDVNGRVHILANGDIGTVTNLSRHPVEDFVDVAVAAAADMAAIAHAIESAGEELLAAEETPLLAAPRMVGVIAFSAGSTTIRVSVLAKPRDLAQAQIAVRTALRAALLSAGVPLSP